MKKKKTGNNGVDNTIEQQIAKLVPVFGHMVVKIINITPRRMAVYCEAIDDGFNAFNAFNMLIFKKGSSRFDFKVKFLQALVLTEVGDEESADMLWSIFMEDDKKSGLLIENRKGRVRLAVVRRKKDMTI